VVGNDRAPQEACRQALATWEASGRRRRPSGGGERAEQVTGAALDGARSRRIQLYFGGQQHRRAAVPGQPQNAAPGGPSGGGIR